MARTSGIVLIFAILAVCALAKTTAKTQKHSFRDVQPGIDHWEPVIGVFAQPSQDLNNYYDQTQGYSYAAASYVKWIQSAGARVIPIPYNIPTQDELDFLLDRLNGIVMPGGDASLWVDEATHTGFSNMTYVGQAIFNKIKQYNDKGEVFPIWATCMSYEMLVLIVTQNPKILNNFDSNNHPLNTTIIAQSNLYDAIPAQYHPDIEKREAFFYNHMYGLKPETFTSNAALTDMFRLTSTSYYKNQTFVATLEGIKYPFVLSQYHPEKNAFEWLPGTNANHADYAVTCAQYEANYFVNLARKSPHRFTEDEYAKYTIFNYPDIDTEDWQDFGFAETYIFRASMSMAVPPQYITPISGGVVENDILSLDD